MILAARGAHGGLSAIRCGRKVGELRAQTRVTCRQRMAEPQKRSSSCNPSFQAGSSIERLPRLTIASEVSREHKARDAPCAAI